MYQTVVDIHHDEHAKSVTIIANTTLEGRDHHYNKEVIFHFPDDQVMAYKAHMKKIPGLVFPGRSVINNASEEAFDKFVDAVDSARHSAVKEGRKLHVQHREKEALVAKQIAAKANPQPVAKEKGE